MSNSSPKSFGSSNSHWFLLLTSIVLPGDGIRRTVVEVSRSNQRDLWKTKEINTPESVSLPAVFGCMGITSIKDQAHATHISCRVLQDLRQRLTTTEPPASFPISRTARMQKHQYYRAKGSFPRLLLSSNVSRHMWCVPSQLSGDLGRLAFTLSSATACDMRSGKLGVEICIGGSFVFGGDLFWEGGIWLYRNW